MNQLKAKIRIHPNLKQYDIEETLGEGTYGKVKLATHKLTNEKVAIKFVEKSKLIRINDTNRIKTEMKIISELNHPNILKAIEIFEDEDFFYIVMERPIKGDLFNYICSKKRLSLKEASFMFYQIVNALSYIHSHGVTHRDLKPENIMLSEDMIIKLGDFGLSSYYTEGVKLKTTCGSPMYSSPEMLKGRQYDPIPVDIWGLGIILYVMICGLLPFEDQREDMLFIKINRCEVSYPYFCNQSCKALIKQILLPDPKQRMSIEDIKKSSVYISGKANFIKEFKIYDDDGSVLPQVHRYIRDMSLKSLEQCAVELSANSDKSAGFKVFYYKYLHRTDWQNYHIPFASVNQRAIYAKEEEDTEVYGNVKKKKSNKAKTKDTMSDNSGTKVNKAKKRLVCLLTIRDRSSMTSLMYNTNTNANTMQTEKNKHYSSVLNTLTSDVNNNNRHHYALTAGSVCNSDNKGRHIEQSKVVSPYRSSSSNKKGSNKNDSFTGIDTLYSPDKDKDSQKKRRYHSMERSSLHLRYKSECQWLI